MLVKDRRKKGRALPWGGKKFTLLCLALKLNPLTISVGLPCILFVRYKVNLFSESILNYGIVAGLTNNMLYESAYRSVLSPHSSVVVSFDQLNNQEERR